MNTTRMLLTFALIAGCSRTEPAREAPPPTAAAPAEKKAEPPKPSIEDTTFRLALSGPSEVEAGKAGSLELTLEARGGYHVNQEYPIRVDVKAPAGIKLEKTTLGKPDAAQFSDERARFELPFSADKGAHDLTATVDFAVCTKDTCVPDQRTVALSFAAR